MKPQITKDRLSLTDSSVYYIYGTWKKGMDVLAMFGETALEHEYRIEEYFDAKERFILSENGLVNIALKVTLPKPLPASGALKIYSVNGPEKILWYVCPASMIAKKQSYIQHFIEKVTVTARGVNISGWAASAEKISIEPLDRKGNHVPAEIKRYKRPDVNKTYKECVLTDDCGFEIIISDPGVKHVSVVFSTPSFRSEEKIALGKRSIAFKRFRENVGKTIRFIRTSGVRALPEKIALHNKNMRMEVDYDLWIQHHLPSEDKLKEQRGTSFEYEPLFSVVVPLYRTPEAFLRKLIDSVRAQSYSNWELVLSDGSGSPSPIASILNEAASSDKRIKVLEAADPFKITENTNRAILASSGEFIAFLDHDDELTPDALFECAKALNEDRTTDYIYSDEDKMNQAGNGFFQPNMKPDFNIDLLRSVNYICHLSVIRRSLIDKAGLLNPAYEGAQDYDLTLRCVELTGRIHHIPRVLYHWRSHEASTAENPESKRYAFDAGRRAVQAHLDRLGIDAEVTDGAYPGLYRTRYIRTRDPKVSILIPNKDHIDDLKRCIDSIEEKCTYKNYEYVIIENNSTEESTFEYYKELQKNNPKVRVVFYKGSFNFSDINNFGEENAEGEYLLLLNNDTEMMNGDSFEDMLGFCMRKDVGAVGARLYYEDDTIQHAGVVIGFGGIAGHAFVQTAPGFTGYQHRIICAADFSAVTAACMMVDRKVFHEIGRFDPSLAVAFNDVDLCLKIRSAGYLVVYDPYAELHHYESKSRGLEDTPEKVSRFNSEIETMENRWADIIKNGDPMYNRNQSLDTQDFSLARNY